MKLLTVVLGTTDYQEALTLQETLVKMRQMGVIEDTLLLLEHPPTLTIGARGDEANIVVDKEFLQENGVKIYRVNRGGDVTYHGPGQVVGYPMLDLTKHGKDIKEFLRKIEEAFIQLLHEVYGITAGRDSRYTGVWVGREKITAIGCAVKRWVTMHGFAFNVNAIMEHFLWINPCGIVDRGVTSLKKLLGYPVDMHEVNTQVVSFFAKQFDLEPESISAEKLLHLIRSESDETETA